MPRKTPESPGSRLIREVREIYELSPTEELLLERLAAVADALVRIDAAVADGDLISVGSKGQPVPAPLLREQREHGARLAALIEALALPGRGEGAGRSASSRSAQRAAHIRWSRGKEA